jgi:Tol biopolymer transport system component
VVRDLGRLPVLADEGLDKGTIDSGSDHLSQGPRFSSDGKRIVYVSDKERRGDKVAPGLDVFVYQVADGQQQKITTYPMNAERPTISKDGDRIAFETSRPAAGGGPGTGGGLGGSGIYLVNIHGRTPTLIAHDGHEPSFSPDGRWILYATGGDAFLSMNHARIYLYEVKTGQRFRLAQNMADARIPLWNSDGDHILFSGCGPQSKTAYPDCGDWWVTSVTDERPGMEGGPVRPPQPTGAAQVLASQRLQPTRYLGGWQDDTVVFSAHGDSQVVGLWEIKLNPRRAKVKGRARQLVRDNQGDFIISSSIAGSSIAYCRWNPSIYVTRVEEKVARATNPTPSRVTYASEFELGPSISRNGRFLIFTRGYKQARKIHVLDMQNHEQEVNEPSFDDMEINSPIIDDSGTRIAFEAKENKTPVIRVSTEEKGKQTLCRDCRNATAWMSEPTRILYGDKDLQRIQVRNVNGGDATTILEAEGKFVRDAAWSPETRYFAFTVLKEVPRQNALSGEDDREIEMQVYAAPYVSGQSIPEDKWIKLTGDEEYSRKPQWSGDGRTIYFLSRRDGNWCVWAQGFNPERGRPVGEPFELIAYHDPGETPGSVPASGLNLSAGGDKLYLNVLKTSGNIYRGELVRPGLFSRDE